MEKWMNRWKNGWMDGKMDGWMDEQLRYKCLYIQIQMVQRSQFTLVCCTCSVSTDARCWRFRIYGSTIQWLVHELGNRSTEFF